MEQARAAIVVDREEVARLKAYLEEHGPQRRDLEARLEALRKECEAEEKKKRKFADNLKMVYCHLMSNTRKLLKSGNTQRKKLKR